MSTTIFIVVLAMLAMVNAAPVQEDQNNLQGLLDILADQKTNKESVAQAAKLVKQQQDDDGSQEAEAQLFGRLLRRAVSLYANKQQDDNGNLAEAQFFGKLLRHAVSLYANKQQDDDNGNQVEAQLFGRLLKNVARKYAAKYGIYANVQQGDGDDIAEAQLWGALARGLFKIAAPIAARHGLNYLQDKLG